jgi:hypothetical protein
MATINRGWSLLMLGKREVGSALLRHGVALVDRTGAALARPSYQAMLAVADVLEENRDAGLARFDEALAEVERTGERFQAATLLLGKSRLLAEGGARGGSPRAYEVEACLRRALDIARTQGARLLELRAGLALARQYGAHARRDEARAILESVYAWFVDRPVAMHDVAAAQRLLATLQA